MNLQFIAAQSAVIETEKPASLLDLWSVSEVVNITIQVNLDSLLANRRTDDYTPGSFSFNAKKKVLTFEVDLKPRGKFRRAECDFPPLKLNFSKKDLKAAGLASFDEFKLVTHCLDDNAISKSLVLKEYLTYKLYSVITPFSYRVQLAKITYRDTHKKGRKMTRWGFIIEGDKEFAQRNGVVECECLGQTVDKMNLVQEKMTSLFQFMVGNTDWDVLMLRNLKLMEQADGKLALLPYDFDFSRLVRAPYARPNQDVGQTIKMERIYMGMTPPNQLSSTLAHFKSKKDRLIATILDFRHLDSNEKQEMVQYLEDFFDLITRDNQLENITTGNR